jgi:hypothetical protein
LPQAGSGGTETLLIEAKEGRCCPLQVGGHFNPNFAIGILLQALPDSNQAGKTPANTDISLIF